MARTRQRQSGQTDLYSMGKVGRQLHRFPRCAAILQHPQVLRTDIPVARRDAVDLTHQFIGGCPVKRNMTETRAEISR